MSGEERDEAKQALQRATLLESVIDSMAEGVMLIDREGAEIYRNRTLRRLREQTNAPTMGSAAWREVYGQRIADGEGRLMPFEAWPHTRALRGEFVENMEVQVMPDMPGPALMVMLVTSRPFVDEAGEIDGAVIVIHDITAMRHTEERLRQSQKLETIGQLTGGIAHDFNNMLAAIMSSADVIKRGVAGNAILEQASSIVEKAAMRGAELTRHLLAFARRQNLQPTVVDVGALIKDALLILRPGLSASIAVTVEAPGEPLHARADAAQLTSALLNLCLNARDAMPDGGSLTIVLASAVIGTDHGILPPGDYVRVSVRDTGAGMSEEVRRRAVEPFFTTKDVGKGSGLGLSMVFGFARQSGGDISIESTLGQGSTVSLLLPQVEAPAASHASAPAAAPVGRMRVLVVDDDEMVRGALALQLADEGFAALCATDGPDALRLLDAGAEVDILLTDMVMPGGMSGADLAAAVRERRQKIRVILSTGYVDTDVGAEGLVLLRKPYTAQQLLTALRSAVLGG